MLYRIFSGKTAKPLRHGVIVLASIIVGAAYFTGTAFAADIEIKMAWASPAHDTAKPGAIFMQIVNKGGDDKLVGMETPVAEIAQIHNSKMKKKKMRMRRKKELAVGAGQTVKFAHGGTHIMLVKLKSKLMAGSHFPLKLKFEKAGTIDVKVPVKKGGMGGHSGH